MSSLLELADLALQLDNPAGARDSFHQTLSLENHPGAYYGLATGGESPGQDEDQITRNCREAVRPDPSHTKAYFYLAHVYFGLKDYAEARDLFLRYLNLEPEDSVCYNDLGSFHGEQKGYQKAQVYFLGPLDLRPSYVRALYNMGVAENRLSRPQEALVCYEQSLEEYSRSYTCLNMPAIYFALKEGQEVKKALLWGLAHHQGSINLHYSLIRVYVHLKNLVQVLEELKKAMETNPHVQNWARTDIDSRELVKEP